MKRLTLMILAFLFSSTAFASLFGDEIDIYVDAGSPIGVIFDGKVEVGPEREVELPDWIGGDSLFYIDGEEDSFVIWADAADDVVFGPWEVRLSSLDWLDADGDPLAGKIDSVERIETEGGAETWLDEITFGDDFITLTSSGPARADPLLAALYAYTASHDEPESCPGGGLPPCDEEPPGTVPEPSIIALFAAGLFGLGFARRRKA